MGLVLNIEYFLIRLSPILNSLQSLFAVVVTRPSKLIFGIYVPIMDFTYLDIDFRFYDNELLNSLNINYVLLQG